MQVSIIFPGHLLCGSTSQLDYYLLPLLPTTQVSRHLRDLHDGRHSRPRRIPLHAPPPDGRGRRPRRPGRLQPRIPRPRQARRPPLVGNANELNAGYAADGYARLKGAGALATSFGVGELSALNAVAGAYAERVPVVHVVGTPSRAAQADGACLHHSLGDGNFRVFADMYASVTVAQARLDCPATAPRSVDEVLRACLVESRPVYIELPSDMAAAKVPRPMAVTDLWTSTTSAGFWVDKAQVLCSMIAEAKRPMILVDGFAARFHIRKEINQLVRISQIPTLTTPFGKGIVDETLPGYKGMFCGSMGNQDLQDWVDGCDLCANKCVRNSYL
ncbi:pyruvate decarboxylase [Verticillium alfalfae VaMs.102]|uniref:Pyruvate decarboxylase n=1 Tax=Verticillium alfalfae (strain VaMs.102 / ATCC MYA-4576 / FGSC 10136) TaxID=526221 RepID=C9SQ55_VERA1|nr:pyruvate decarboxylase [Verticillium alfalfae VaMs.102]EEY20980.1 pyruvate decarboxylase [Verticillium alfalfae VaMs.102]